MKHWFTQSISKLSRSTSTGWGSETAWTTSSETNPIMGRINPSGGGEQYAGDKQGIYATHKMYCSSTETISMTDRVAYAGTTYGIVFIKDTLGLGHHKTIYLREPV